MLDVFGASRLTLDVFGASCLPLDEFDVGRLPLQMSGASVSALDVTGDSGTMKMSRTSAQLCPDEPIRAAHTLSQHELCIGVYLNFDIPINRSFLVRVPGKTNCEMTERCDPWHPGRRSSPPDVRRHQSDPCDVTTRPVRRHYPTRETSLHGS